MNTRSFLIAGTNSGCGKTTVSLGIMAALIGRGLTVQPFKVGPDFIDPGHHRRITGRDSHNLDGWMMDHGYNQAIFERYGRDADVAVVEGVMGLFDGYSGGDEAGSTAEMSKWLDLPVILVIDARAMARSAAAVALGYSRFDLDVSMEGVVFNRVGSKGHGDVLIEAMRSVPDVSLLGCLPREEEIEIPSRHLGLITDEDLRMDPRRVQRLACWIEENMDLDNLLSAIAQPIISSSSAYTWHDAGEHVATAHGRMAPDVRIGIARDEAFSFYYPENLRLLMEAGAHLVPFSPLRSKHLPDRLNGLILGGGYPELHTQALSENRTLLAEVREFGLSGGPVYAECGGFMFLGREICDLEGHTFPMAGIFPMAVQMEKRLKALGYREITTRKESILGPSGTRIRGHEFHYSRIEDMKTHTEKIYSVTDRKLLQNGDEGFVRKRVLGSYVHLHWGSNPEVAQHFVNYCRR